MDEEKIGRRPGGSLLSPSGAESSPTLPPPADSAAGRHLASSAGWTIADQAVSSLSNFGLSVLIARSVDAQAFGAFAISFTLYSFLLGASRCFSGLPLGVRFSGSPVSEFRRAATAATGTALVFGAVTGALLLCAGVFLGGQVGVALQSMGLVMPAVLLQDCWRSVFISAKRARLATLNDVVWVIVQFSAVSWQLQLGVDSASPLVLSWGLAGGMAALLGILQFRAWPRPALARSWVAQHIDQSGFYLAEWVTVLGAAQCALLLIAALGSPADVGALRAAQVLLGPVNILAFGVYSFALPELARRPRMSEKVRQWWAVFVSVPLVGASLLWGALLLLMPDGMGRELIGATWPAARMVLPASIAIAAGGAMSTGPAVALRAMGQARVTLRVNLLLAPLLLIFAVVGFLLAEASGAAAGMALAYWTVSPMWWIRLRGAARTSSEART